MDSKGRTAITWQQLAFVWEKLLGLNDQNAALRAGYSPSVAKNTKGKIWSRPGVREEHAAMKQWLRLRYGVQEGPMNYIVKITSGRFAGQFLSVGYGSSENYETWRSRVGGLVNAKELFTPQEESAIGLETVRTREMLRDWRSE